MKVRGQIHLRKVIKLTMSDGLFPIVAIGSSVVKNIFKIFNKNVAHLLDFEQREKMFSYYVIIQSVD